MNTPTPETDAITRTFRDPCAEVIGNKIVDANFARKLERERDQLSDQNALLREALREAKLRIIYVGMPQEPMIDGKPDWVKWMIQIENALTSTPQSAHAEMEMLRKKAEILKSVSETALLLQTQALPTLKEWLHYQYPATVGDIRLNNLLEAITAAIEKEKQV